jgi:hypothetical protein
VYVYVFFELVSTNFVNILFSLGSGSGQDRIRISNTVRGTPAGRLVITSNYLNACLLICFLSNKKKLERKQSKIGRVVDPDWIRIQRICG